MSDVLTIADLARMVDVSAETIRRDCVSGRIPGATQAGRTWIIPRKAGLAYAKSREPYDALRKQDDRDRS